MIDYSAYEYLKIEVAERVATVTINRPEQLNAVHAALHHEFEQIWLEVRQKVQSRLSRAEVIDGGQKTPRTVRLQNRQQMAMISNLAASGRAAPSTSGQPASP